MRPLKIITAAVIAGFLFYSTAGAGENVFDGHKGHRGEKTIKVAEEIDKIIGHFREKLDNEPKFKEHISAMFDLNKDGKLSDNEIKNAIILAPFHMRGRMMPPPPPFNGEMGPHPGMMGFPPPPPPGMRGHMPQHPGMMGNFPPPQPGMEGCFPPPPQCPCMRGEMNPQPGMRNAAHGRFGAFRRGPEAGWWSKNKPADSYRETGNIDGSTNTIKKDDTGSVYTEGIHAPFIKFTEK